MRSAMSEPTRRQITKAVLLTSGVIAGGIAPRHLRAAGEIRRGGTLNIVIQPEPPILVSLTHTAGPAYRGDRAGQAGAVSARRADGFRIADYSPTRLRGNGPTRQSQWPRADRDRPVRLQGMETRRPHPAGAQPELLGSGQAVSRP